MATVSEKMLYHLDMLNESELRLANQVVCGKLNGITKSVHRNKILQKFVVGDRVEFTHKGVHHEATVVRLIKKTISAVDSNGHKWRLDNVDRVTKI